MKKLIALILTLALSFSLAACSTKEPDPEPSPTPGSITSPDVTAEPAQTPESTKEPENTPTANPTPSPTPAESETTAAKTPEELTSLLETILDGTDPIPMNSGTMTELPKDNDTYQYNLYIDYEDGYECMTYAPMVSSTAYFVALLSVPSDADIDALAAAIKDNADPDKWICVSADQVDTVVNGNVILFYMLDSDTYPNTADTLTANFTGAAV